MDFSDYKASTSRWLKLHLPAPTCDVRYTHFLMCKLGYMLNFFWTLLCDSCGWFRAATLDTNSTVWNLTAWGRPFQLVSPFLDCSSPETTPIQVECSWFSAALTRSGDVYLWWPFTGALSDQYTKVIQAMKKDESLKAVVSDNETVIPCHTFSIHMDPVKAPTLPNLPDLPATGLSERKCRKETKLIKIAIDNFSLIGLTNKGHVLKLDGLKDENCMLTWHYVSESTNSQTCSQLGYTAIKVLWYRKGEGAPSLPYQHRHRWPGNTTRNGVTIKYHAHHPCKLHYPMGSGPYIWYYLVVRFLHKITPSLLIHPQWCFNWDPLIHQRLFQPSSWCLRRNSHHMWLLVNCLVVGPTEGTWRSTTAVLNRYGSWKPPQIVWLVSCGQVEGSQIEFNPMGLERWTVCLSNVPILNVVRNVVYLSICTLTATQLLEVHF